MEHRVFMDSLKKELNYMGFGNFYPSRKRLFYTIFGMIIYLTVWADFLTKLAVAFMYIERGAWTKVLEMSNITFTWAALLVKLTFFVIKRNNLVKIEKVFKHPILNDLDEEQANISDSYGIQLRRIAVALRAVCWQATASFAIFRYHGLSHDYENQIALLPDWFPIDARTCWRQIYLWQMFALVVMVFHNTTIDILFCLLTTFGSAQFDILKNKLENSAIRIQSEALNEMLRTCAKHHQILIAYTQTLQDTISAGICMEFICTVLSICLTGFQIFTISSLKSIEFFFSLVFLVGVILQIALFCWCGNELRENSSGVPQACYMSAWHTSNNSEARKILWIIMERGKRPIALKAGKFFTLSLTSFLAVLRSSYSYFAVLQQVTIVDKK